jgi:hypothetical protein
MIGLTIIAVFAMSAFAAASASASLFLSTQTTTLLDKSTSSHTFTTGGGASVVCSGETSTGKATAGGQLEVLSLVKYTGCKVSIFEATVSEADYDFSADGLVNLLNTVTINVPAGGCHVTVGPQDLNNAAKYDNLAGGQVDVLANATGISSTGSGGSCGGASNTGTYSGNSLVTPHAGAFSWDAGA